MCVKRAAESDIHHLTPFDIYTRTHTPLPSLFIYKEVVMPSSPKGQYLTFRGKSRDIHQRVKSSKFSHWGGGVTNQTCAQKGGRREKWQTLHPVIYAESFEVEPEG